jgi:CBS domain containing-hemolysin-like protein
VLEADGGTTVEEVTARFGMTLPAGHAVTLAGRLVEQAGRIPAAGERFRFGGLEIDVLRASPLRVERLVVRRIPVAPVTIGRAEP